MTRFHFPGFSMQAKATPPATPRKSSQPDEAGWSREPCDFMPQSPAPLMIMSSATQQRRSSADDRAIRCLEMVGSGRSGTWTCDRKRLRVLTCETESEDEEGDEKQDMEGAGAEDTSDDTHFDINKTPMTPPRTPTTDTTLPTSDSGLSGTLFTKSWDHLKGGTTMTTVLLALGLGVVLVSLLLLAFLGTEGVKSDVCELMGSIWTMLVVVSDTVEVGIEGLGWIIGRAVGRFGRGFQRGYRM